MLLTRIMIVIEKKYPGRTVVLMRKPTIFKGKAPAEHRDMMFDSTIFSTFVKFFWK